MTTFFNSQSDIDVLTNAWEHHLSGFVGKVNFINQQRPLFFLSAYKQAIYMSADELLEEKGMDVNAVRCFIEGA